MSLFSLKVMTAAKIDGKGAQVEFGYCITYDKIKEMFKCISILLAVDQPHGIV